MIPGIRGYDPGRMRRAMQLACERLGPDQFRVKGQQEPYYDVDLTVDPACYCADQYHRGAMCKHEIISRLKNGDERLLQSLGDMLLAAEKIAKAATARTKTRTTHSPETR